MRLLFKGIKKAISKLQVKGFLLLQGDRDTHKSNTGLYLNFTAAVKFIRITETRSYPFFFFLLANIALILTGLGCEDVVAYKMLPWL